MRWLHGFAEAAKADGTVQNAIVRGYDPGSFEAGECGNVVNGSCPAFDRLIGSRVAIANAELRFPLWGAFAGGDRFYGPLPIEMAPKMVPTRLPLKNFSAVAVINGPREPIMLPKKMTKRESNQ